MKRPKKRGAGLSATEPPNNKLSEEKIGLSCTLFQDIRWDDCSYHPSVKSWGKPKWLTEEFEAHLSKSTKPRKEGGSNER